MSAGGPGGRDQTLAVESRKNVRKITFFSLKKIKFTPKKSFFFIYLLVMPKYWRKQIFSLGCFPEVDQNQKTEKKKEERKRLKVGNNNGELRLANATSGGARKPPGPKQSSVTSSVASSVTCYFVRHFNSHFISHLICHMVRHFVHILSFFLFLLSSSVY